MRRVLPFLALLVPGEALLLYGLWLAWLPLAFMAAGGQLLALALTREVGA